MNKHLGPRLVLLLGWVLGILLPLYSFRRFSPTYQAAFDWVFPTDASHVLMHTFLYAVLANLLASFLAQIIRSSRRALAGALVGVAIVAALQEAVQMGCEHVPLGPDEIFDLGVDFNGGVLGILLHRWISRRQTQA